MLKKSIFAAGAVAAVLVVMPLQISRPFLPVMSASK